MNGILCMNKPQDFTSFDVIAKLRGILKIKRLGHAGTLDPMATGVLPVFVGTATKACDILPDNEKSYLAGFKTGLITDTQDITGKTVSEFSKRVTKEEIIDILPKFTGSVMQLPPMYSAVSVNGQRLYDLARKGIEVERQPRKVIIYSIDILSSDEAAGEYEISVSCSSGTYIRTLIDDIGRKLGCGAVLTKLRRTRANGFDVSQAVTLEELEAASEKGEAEGLLIPLEKALGEYPEVHVTEAQAKRFSNGGELALERLKCPKICGFFRVYGPENRFLGLGEIADGDSLEVKRVYNG